VLDGLDHKNTITLDIYRMEKISGYGKKRTVNHNKS
jgi:hypothetical protein